MDIPRIGYGAAYRPAQLGAGRPAERVPGQPFGQPEAKTPEAKTPEAKTPDAKSADLKGLGSTAAGGAKAPGALLSEDEQKQVAKLKAIDTKVRQHEAAHQGAGGGLVGGASFTYTKGPDGHSYATGGEVPISAPAAGSPEAAIRQAQQVKAAALAPGDPSGQDLAVAAAATAQMAEARQQLATARDPNAAGRTEGQSGERPAGEGAGHPAERPAAPGAPQAGSEPVSGLPGAASEAAAIPALVARGLAAYGAASQVNAAPRYANPLFA